MLTKLFGGGLFGLCCGFAQAAPQHLAFTNIDFHEVATNSYRSAEPFPGATIDIGYVAPPASFPVRTGAYLAAGVSNQSLRNAAGEARERTLEWTPATNFLISAVPEPTTYTMLAVGLGLVGVAARRQRRFLRG